MNDLLKKSYLTLKTCIVFFTAITVLMPVAPAFSGPPRPPRIPGVFRPPHPPPVPRPGPPARHGVVVEEEGIVRPGHRPGRRFHPAPLRPRYHLQPIIPYGRIIHSLPAAFLSLSVAGALFYYHMGTYYRQGPNGYVVVSAPTGAVITTLPAGYSSVVHSGMTYYVYGGVYYRPHNTGFIVVSNPTGGVDQTTTVTVPAATVIPSHIRVTAIRLNVRKKPRQKSMIISQLTQGTIVKVTGNVQKWYQIRMVDGTKGWVMIKFTTPIMPADG